MNVRKYTVILFGIAFLCLCANFLLDSSNCFIGRCLTKHSTFSQIQVGMSSAEVANLFHHGGVDTNLAASTGSNVIMFSDFWRNYLISTDRTTGVVVRKAFAFREHGEGLLEFLRFVRSR